ncbi:PLRG1 [Mytilus edulis]|uniref:rRNA biogenesis protein RRP36 n=1 Tax=Mytilus edulis TaxID=6550 RepID=A0A8S3VDL3_MYTED|nr:PLRG1 [Mytilus edulis]
MPFDLHPTIDVLVTCGRDGTARVWDMRTKACIHTLTGHNNTVADIRCQAAEPQVITGSHDSTIRLWDLAAGKSRVTLTNHKKSVRALTLHPKQYNQVVHGDKVKKPTSKRSFKRENKNRPMEMSSKRPVRLSKESDPAKKKMTRDPRFDDLSGEYNESYFKSNYSFLYDIKSREKEKIKKTMKKEKDPEKKVELKMLYNRMTAQFPLTEFQLDKMVDELDMDGDGEVDFSKLEKMFENYLQAKGYSGGE